MLRVNLYCRHTRRLLMSQIDGFGRCRFQSIRLWIIEAGSNRAHITLLRKGFADQVFNKLALPALLPWIAFCCEFLKHLLGRIAEVKVLPVLFYLFFVQRKITSLYDTIIAHNLGLGKS